MEGKRKPNPEPATCVVDLGSLSAACRNLIGWYDQLICGHQPPITDLDRIMTALQELGTVPGRVGRDIEIVIDGGVHTSERAVVAAVERLRGVGDHTPAAPQRPPTKPRRRSRRRKPDHIMVPLPGFEPPAPEPRPAAAETDVDGAGRERRGA